MQIEKIFLVKVFENSPLARLFGIYGLQNVSVKGLFFNDRFWFNKNKKNTISIYRVFDLLSLQLKSYESKLSPTLTESKAVARCATR